MSSGKEFRPISAVCEGLADNNSWIVNGTPNLRIVREMLKSTEPLASDNVLYSL